MSWNTAGKEIIDFMPKWCFIFWVLSAGIHLNQLLYLLDFWIFFCLLMSQYVVHSKPQCLKPLFPQRDMCRVMMYWWPQCMLKSTELWRRKMTSESFIDFYAESVCGSFLIFVFYFLEVIVKQILNFFVEGNNVYYLSKVTFLAPPIIL